MKPIIAIVCILLYLWGGGGQSHAFDSATQRQPGQTAASTPDGGTRVAKPLQSADNWLRSSVQQDVRQAYELLGSCNTTADVNSKVRGLTPHATALLGPMGINRFDLMQGVVFNNLAKKKKLESLEYDYTQTVFHPRLHAPASKEQNPIDYFKPITENSTAVPQVSPSVSNLTSTHWDAWLSPITAFERYDAKSETTENASAATLGMSAGSVRHFKNYSIGFAGFFLRSAPTGGGWTADIETYSVMAALENPAYALGPLSPRVRLGAAYSFSEIKQNRDDVLGFSHSSGPGQHGIRLAANVGQKIPMASWLNFTPTVGLDYTFIRQGAYVESGNGLRLKVNSASMHSVRPFMSGELKLAPLDGLTLTAHGLVRHEMGDRTLRLSSQIANAPLAFSSQGHKYSRSSGTGGLRLSWQASADMSFSAHYDVLMGDRYPGHHAQSPAAMSFDGESYDGSSGNGGLAFSWRLADSLSLNATYDAVFDGDAPQTLMNAVITWEF